MGSIRKKETEEAYSKVKEERKALGIVGFEYNLAEEKIIKNFTHWVIIEAKFPYDLIAKEHHMLVPRRVIGSLEEANSEELYELGEIKKGLHAEYNYILETLAAMQSNPGHLHLHLVTLKENPCEC